MSLLEVNRLKKAFGTHLAVEDVSFTVGEGEILGLLGPNGAGKSTTMMMLAGLIEPDAGSIVLDGHTLSHTDRKSRQQMGIVPQDLAIYPNLTARENLRFFGGLYGLSGAEMRSRIAEVLSQTGLADRQNDLTCEYSGGMKRRLNFGVALLHRPRLLILDEPTVGVDPQSRAHLLDCVRQLAREGMSVIYCSHYMEEVQELCDRVAIVDRGKLLACDRIDRLLGELGSTLRLHLIGASGELRASLTAIPGVTLQQREDCLIASIARCCSDENQTLLNTLTAAMLALRDAGGQLTTVESDEPDLERLFLQMTGSRLRE